MHSPQNKDITEIFREHDTSELFQFLTGIQLVIGTRRIGEIILLCIQRNLEEGLTK